MKTPKHLPNHLLCFTLWISCLFSGCKRDIPPLPTNELRNITFKLEGFEAEVTPLDARQSMARSALGAVGNGMQALRNITPGSEPQYLYYWSFNEGNVEPFIAVDEVGAAIVFAGKDAEPDFVAGFGLAPIEAGKALSITGAQSVEINLPMQGIESVTTFGFDITSSSTGPKDFSLSYSTDGGDTYEVLSATNPFGVSSRDRFSFDLSAYPEFIGMEALILKFEFLPGDRGEGSEYNENTGTLKLDNIRLSGVYNSGPGDATSPSTLHYYIFSSEDGEVVQQQALSMSALGDGGMLDVMLADGTYDVLFVAYRSDKGMLLPEDPANASEFYMGQHFDDFRAVTYASFVEDMVVSGVGTEVAAILSRCYSLVEFDFTDAASDLQRVKEIEVVRLHDDFLYAPFGMPASIEMSETQRITFDNFIHADDYKIALHQFFGLLDERASIGYELIAYGEGDVVLHTITVTQEIPNNVRLRLTGKLLGDTGAVNGFSVALDTAWGETLEHEF